jgi:amino acid permease
MLICCTLQLLRGNFGPGLLAVPFVFAQTGWLLGAVVTILVCLQGMYCMWLLVHCKQLVNSEKVHTFAQLVSFTLGSKGGMVVQAFLVLMQGGVCCVYVQLLSTNLRAALKSGGMLLADLTCVTAVVVILIPLSMLRNISQLKIVTTMGNVFMVSRSQSLADCANSLLLVQSITVITVVLYAGMTIYEEPSKFKDATAATDDLSKVVVCISSLFYSYEGIALMLHSIPIDYYYSYEGIALMLPIENSMRNR